MSTVADVDGRGQVLEGRYRLPAALPEGDKPVVLEAMDELLARRVSLLLFPLTGALGDRLALRLQLRRTAKTVHPRLAEVFDVIDGPEWAAVVFAHRPGGRLLGDGVELPPAGPQQLRDAVLALHASGRAHGAVSEDAVLVLPDASVLLLPLPTKPSALMADDLQDLHELVLRHAARVAADQTAALSLADMTNAATAALPINGGGHPATSVEALHTSVIEAPTQQPTPGPAAQHRHRPLGARRGALILAGGCAGALVADVLSHLTG